MNPREQSSRSISELESQIRESQADYVAVGSALTEIQKGRLYKPQYNIFEEYCEKRWGFARQTAYDYIHAAKVNVRLTVQNPPSFTQAVELSRLEPEQQKAVAEKINFADATVEQVKDAVKAIRGEQPKPKTPEPKEITLEDALESFVTKIVMQPYGYYAAKFQKYPFQHTTELAVVQQAKREVYEQIAKICAALEPSEQSAEPVSTSDEPPMPEPSDSPNQPSAVRRAA